MLWGASINLLFSLVECDRGCLFSACTLHTVRSFLSSSLRVFSSFPAAFLLFPQLHFASLPLSLVPSLSPHWLVSVAGRAFARTAWNSRVGSWERGLFWAGKFGTFLDLRHVCSEGELRFWWVRWRVEPRIAALVTFRTSQRSGLSLFARGRG